MPLGVTKIGVWLSLGIINLIIIFVIVIWKFGLIIKEDYIDETYSEIKETVIKAKKERMNAREKERNASSVRERSNKPSTTKGELKSTGKPCGIEIKNAGTRPLEGN